MISFGGLLKEEGRGVFSHNHKSVLLQVSNMSSSGDGDKFEEIVDILEEVDERVRDDMSQAVEVLESYKNTEDTRQSIDELVANKFIGYVLQNPRKDDETLKMLENRADRLSKLAGYERKPFEDGDIERPSEQNQPLMTRRQAVTGLAGAGLGALAGFGLGGGSGSPQQRNTGEQNSNVQTVRFGTDKHTTEDFQKIYNAALDNGLSEATETPPISRDEREDYFDGDNWEMIFAKITYKPGSPEGDSVLTYRLRREDTDDIDYQEGTINDSVAGLLVGYKDSDQKAQQYIDDELGAEQ